MINLTREQIEEMRDEFRRTYNADLTDPICDMALRCVELEGLLQTAIRLRHELMAVVTGVERSSGRFNESCLRTIRRVVEKLSHISTDLARRTKEKEK